MYRSSPEYRAVISAKAKEYKNSLPRHEKSRRSRASKLRSFGMTMSQYEERLKSQNMGCAICQITTRKFHLDHDHETGKFRGILCDACNKALGVFGDNVDGVKRVIKYLEDTR